MSYGVSFHPVDVKFIRDRVVPYVRNTGSFDDLLPDMIRIERVRARASRWAYLVQDWQMQEWRQKRDMEDAKTKKPPPASLLPDWFDSDLHVSGRPFFITVETAEDVSDVIDRYCSADGDAAVDELAREQLELLNPELLKKIKAPKKSKATDAKITRGLLANLDLCRNFLEWADQDEPFVDEEGDEHDSRQAFAHNFPLAALAFASVLRPSWTAGGHVWPTLLMSRSALSPEDYFEKPTPLFRPLLRSVPRLDEVLKTTIVLNGELGGYVRPGRVRALRRTLNEKRDSIVEMVGYGTEDLRKIDEALCDAAKRKLGFIEATDLPFIMMD